MEEKIKVKNEPWKREMEKLGFRNQNNNENRDTMSR